MTDFTKYVSDFTQHSDPFSKEWDRLRGLWRRSEDFLDKIVRAERLGAVKCWVRDRDSFFQSCSCQVHHIFLKFCDNINI